MKKIGVTVLVLKDGLVLGVSRRHNHNDFGLIGGKVDEGETMWEAAKREFNEETGLTLKSGLPIYFREDGEYIAGVYLATDYEGEIKPQEGEGIVRWVTWETLFEGSFGEYNLGLKQQLDKLDYEFCHKI